MIYYPIITNSQGAGLSNKMKQQEETNNLQEQTPQNSRKKQPQKKNPLLTVIPCLLIGVMLFSGYKIVSQLLEYKKGNDTYREIESDVVVIADTPPVRTFQRPTYYLPPEEPTGPIDPAETVPAETLPPETHPTIADPTRHPGTGSHGSAEVTPEETPEVSTEEQTTEAPPETTQAPPRETTPAQPQELPWLNINFASLKQRNKDVVAWLQGGPSTINLPVVQGQNNEYYLKHLLDGTVNSNGTLFVDYRNNFLKDDVTYIYGHKMKNGSMFGNLDYYDTYSYYRLHPYLRLYTPDAVYELQIIASFYTDETEPVCFNFSSAAELQSKLNYWRSRAQVRTGISASYGDKLVCLYTCAFHIAKGGRLLMICKAVRIA